jgi:ATP-dependent exoDNAse (exonuclease V) beta subunit
VKRNRKPARAVSERRVAADRRNVQRSTGPRTAAGKKRASRIAIKHGLCARDACLEGECAATYATFVHELEEELQPRTPLQRALLPHIANLLWRIDRLPQAQADIFEQELARCAKGETLSASQVLARRFSDDPTRNGFLLIGRYERGLRNQLHRLMARFEWLKKHRATMPIDEDEVRSAERERAERVDAYVNECSRQINAEREAREALDATLKAERDAACQPAREADRQPPAKRTQSNPPPNPVAASPAAKCATFAPAPPTTRTHCDRPPTGEAVSRVREREATRATPRATPRATM